MKKLIYTIIDSEFLGLKTFKFDLSGSLKCFSIPRNLIKDLPKVEDCSNGGIYFLVNNVNHSLYIGQSNNLASRLAEHNKDIKKGDFNTVIALTTGANYFSKTHIDYLEYWYIMKLQNQNYWLMDNKDKRVKEPNINENDRIELDVIIKNIDILLSILDLSFENIEVKEKSEFYDSKNYDENLFYFKKAKAIYLNGEFILLKGSIVHKFSSKTIETINKSSKYYNEIKNSILRRQATQEQWLESNKLKIINEEELETLSDIKLNSPSEGIFLIRGRNIGNGWTDWKNKNKKTLDQIYWK